MKEMLFYSFTLPPLFVSSSIFKPTARDDHARLFRSSNWSRVEIQRFALTEP